MSDDDRRVYDMVTRRFLAVFHPEAVFENTRLETTVADHVFRTSGKVLVVPGWRGVYGEGDPDAGKDRDDDDSGGEQRLPKLEKGETVDVRDVEFEAKETKPPRRYSDASLLGAMETAGKLVDDDAMREAMKESGIGTPATRATIIERLISVGYVERDGRALVASEKGLNVIRLLDGHVLTEPALTGDWEKRLEDIEHGRDSRQKFMADIAKFAGATVEELDAKLKDVKIERASLGPCRVCGQEIKENRKGFSCWSREDPGCGFVIWKSKAGKNLTPAIARELIDTGYTAKQVTGFKGKSGRSFRAKLALRQSEEGKWRVEFDEPWAQDGGAAKPPEAEAETTAATATRGGDGCLTLGDLPFEERRDLDGWRARRARLGGTLGCERLGVSVWELPPGQTAYPYHFHLGDEELLVVLAGTPELRTPDGRRTVAEGELLAFPAGAEGAHQLVNRSDAVVRFLAVSTSGTPDVVLYPDSGKVWAGERNPDGSGVGHVFQSRRRGRLLRRRGFARLS